MITYPVTSSLEEYDRLAEELSILGKILDYFSKFPLEGSEEDRSAVANVALRRSKQLSLLREELIADARILAFRNASEISPTRH